MSDQVSFECRGEKKPYSRPPWSPKTTYPVCAFSVCAAFARASTLSRLEFQGALHHRSQGRVVRAAQGQWGTSRL
jgi:hypothetical protein